MPGHRQQRQTAEKSKVMIDSLVVKWTFLGISLENSVGDNITNSHTLCIGHTPTHPFITPCLHPGTAKHVPAVSTLGFELNSMSICACRRAEGRKGAVYSPDSLSVYP